MRRIESDAEMVNRTPVLYSSPQTHKTNNQETLGAPLGTTAASTIIWYICICVLFIIAFLALILSVLYFLNDSTTEQVIKLYGITGAGSLAVISFVIIFLDCCNDGDREDEDEEAIYRILQIKEKKDKQLAQRRKRLRAEKKVDKAKSYVSHHQQSEQTPVNSQSPARACHHHHHYPASQYVHHIHSHSSPSYQPRYVCKVCHELHAQNTYRYNKADAAVDTSDKLFELYLNNYNRKEVPKSSRDVQTDSTLFSNENRLQNEQKENRPTPTIERNSSLSRNISNISRETTISKGSRKLLPTVKEFPEHWHSDASSERSPTNVDAMTVSDV